MVPSGRALRPSDDARPRTRDHGLVRDEDLALTLAPGEDASRAPAIGAALRAMIERGRAAWPEVDVDDAAFVAHVRGHLPGERDVLDELAALQAEGLYLASACARRDGVAIERFEATHWPEVSRALSQMGIEVTMRDEVLSRLHEILFFGDAGTGTALISRLRRARLAQELDPLGGHPSGSQDAAQATSPSWRSTSSSSKLPAQRVDPEIDYLRRFYIDEFRAALGRAMRSLPRRERSLLRQHYLDKMSLDAVAKAYRVHRATAARWLADAREAVLAKTKAELDAAIDLRPSEVDSVLSKTKRQSTFGGHTCPRSTRRSGRGESPGRPREVGYGALFL